MKVADTRPLIAHVVYRFDTGGLENGVVNLVNRLPADRYRHMIIALTQIGEFRRRIERQDVEFVALDKPPGHALRLYPRLYRLFRENRPSIVHTRNLAALEVALPAWAARVPVRVHSEHGRDVEDLDGSSVKYQRIRRLYRPFVTYYLALSKDLEGYLRTRIGVPDNKLAQIYNGVDAERFRPREGRESIPGCPFVGEDLWLVGTVGRMQAVKDQVTLARAFVRALAIAPDLRNSLRLVMVGDGPLRQAVGDILAAAELDSLCWLPGERNDIPVVLRGFDCFVLPSRAEGISNTILEAMASGIPVIATEVGGNPELLRPPETGELVPAESPDALAAKIVALAKDRQKARDLGRAARMEVERRFSLDAMVAGYARIYDQLMLQAA